MKPYKASLINAITLIIFGGWGYLDSEGAAITALIPIVIGVIILLLNKGLKNEDKTISHIVVLFTVLVLCGLVMPLMRRIGEDDIMGITRVALMMGTSILAVYTFVKSFIVNRSIIDSRFSFFPVCRLSTTITSWLFSSRS